jgi:ankyrin repeat protein
VLSGAVALLWSALAFGAATSSIADAAMNGDMAAVARLIARHADVNAPQADGATALHWAVYRDDLPMIERLIAAGARVTTANRHGATPLALACINGSARAIERLLAAGASPNDRGPNGETALMMASRTGAIGAMTVLLNAGADVNARETLRGTTALMWATAHAHPAAVQLLLDRGADVAVRSNPAALGRTAYLAPTARQRASQLVNDSGAVTSGRAARAQPAPPQQDLDDRDFFVRRQNRDGGGLTALVFAAREGDLASARVLVAHGADVNQATQYGWTPLLTATQNRHYALGTFLLERGADPNLANTGGWTPLYLATDNRNIEGGDYPVRAGDLDHLDFIRTLLARGADVNARAKDSTETRTIFTMQWLYEDGATPFLRAAQSGDVELMKLLLAHGADPRIATANNVTALAAAAGIGWVQGVTYERSEQDNVEAVKLCLELGIDPNAVDGDGRTALHGAAHKGRNAVVDLLVGHGAKLDARDFGSRDTVAGEQLGRGWLPVDYADGLVRVGVQSAIAHPDTAARLRKLMTERGIPVPAPLSSSVCITAACK